MFFLTLFICLVVGSTPLDGSWELDKAHSTGSVDGLMELMGIDRYKRDILKTISVTEGYRITEKEFFFSRKTFFNVGNVDKVYVLGREVDEDDILMGKVKHTAIYSNSRLQETLVRPDGGTFVGVKKVNRDDDHKIIYSMNFTHPNGKKASCIRYFLKRG